MQEEYISVYTQRQAIEDGIFVDVTEQAKKYGFKIPVAITTNLFHSHIAKEEDDRTQNNLNVFLKELHSKLVALKDKSDNLAYLQFNFDGKGHTDVWVAIEAQSPDDPSPCIGIMLPEDY